MKIARFHLGEYFSLYTAKTGGLAYSNVSTHRYWYLEETKREAHRDEITYRSEDPIRGPFERADFGNRDRLAWANGACEISQGTVHIAWAERYAMWFERSTLSVVDATRAEVARLELPIELLPHKSAIFQDGIAYIQSVRDVVVIAFADLEALFEHGSGQLVVQVREHYPQRRPTARAKVFVEYAFDDHATLIDRDGDGGWLRVPIVYGLEIGDTVTLHDELMKGYFREIEITGYERQTICPLEEDVEGSCALVVERAIDPAGQLVQASTAARTDELDRVFAILADQPDDDAARIVIVDLLEDAGEPYAVHFAKLLNGDLALRDEALGALGNFIHDVEWHGNLPRAATLSPTAPNDEDICALVAADHRLGFFHTLRLGDASFRVYSKFVASPRAVGLRHVDGSRATILQALIAADRRELRRLSNVKFATREVLEALAHPTFDRVVEIETETQSNVVERTLDFIARDELEFFARAPRHLILSERNNRADALVPPVLAAWKRLPLDKLSVAGITLSRDGTAVAVGASEVSRNLVAAQFRWRVG